MNQFNKILVAIDYSENSVYAFNYAIELAKQFKGELTIVNVIHEPVDMAGFYFRTYHISSWRMRSWKTLPK